jgi:23S rRNA (uracil1939-C5)-methyltransferase
MARPLGQGLRELCRGLPDGKQTVAAGPLQGRAVAAADRAELRLPLTAQGLQLTVPAGSFFQANWLLNQDLVGYVASCLSGFGRVADLYAGAGNFALPLALANERVLALESDGPAVAACRRSLLEAGLDNLRVERLDLSACLPGDRLSNFAPRGLVLDPPRTGGGKRGLSSLRGLRSLQRLVWVSCDLVNTCRDLGPFLEQGWRISDMALFDMFPQTWHLETVFVLDRE